MEWESNEEIIWRACMNIGDGMSQAFSIKEIHKSSTAA
jgi:hypothetical protein